MQSRILRDRLVAQWFLLLPLFHQHQLTRSGKPSKTNFKGTIPAKMFDAFCANAYISALYETVWRGDV